MRSGTPPTATATATARLRLSYREEQVWRLLGLGYQRATIAPYLRLSPSYVNTLCAQVLRKLSVHSCQEAAILYLRAHPAALGEITVPSALDWPERHEDRPEPQR